MLGDPEEPDAVPARPDVGHPAEVAGQRRVVPVRRVRVAVRLEDEPGEEGARPDRRAAPEEDADRRAPHRAHAELREPRADAGLSDALTLARSTHGASDHTFGLDRTFTPDEANALLPTVRPLVERLVDAKRAFDAAQERSDEVGRRIAGNGGAIPPAELGELHAEVARLAERAGRCAWTSSTSSASSSRISTPGLVDFPSERDGEPVLLCWRLGEDEIAWYHGHDDGFAGRRPLVRRRI